MMNSNWWYKRRKPFIRTEMCFLIYFYLYQLVLQQMSTGVWAAAMGIGDASGERPICLYYMSDKVKSPDNLSGGDQLLGDGTVLCDAPTDYCFSFWQIDPPLSGNSSDLPRGGAVGEGTEVVSETPGFNWLARGCFKNAHSCLRESCVATERELESSFFCCCKGSRCNERISFKEAFHSPEVTPDLLAQESPLDPFSKTLLFVILPCLMIILLACASVTYFRVQQRKKSLSNSSLGLKRCPTSPCIDLSNLKFLEMLGQGRYGTVYRALLSDEEVAVKLFSPHHKMSFSNEKYIYSLPLMEHENLLSYLGGGEVISPEGNTYLGLVLSYCPGGRLSSFLQENTLDWAAFCRIVVSTVKGLGHLHSDLKKGDLVKPCVSHRDFNTRNILLKADMTCAVSDLGFAIHTQGAKFYQNGEEQIAEMASLTDVGSLRYMAPEVLEGAVNLRDCETSLKQIDIYALGLVLWEIAYRCHDLYQGTQTPNYALPFEAEIGLRPSFEQMQVLVARNKARPLLPQLWKDSNPAIKQLKETIEDCWDNDAEARLSAMCVERRLCELPKLWSRYKASLGMNNVSPTANPPQQGSFVNATTDVRSFLINNELSLPKEKEQQYQHRSYRESSVSDNTVETTIPFSPSDSSGRILGKNQLLEVVNAPISISGPIQPYQGRNPCIERNTINENSNDQNSSSSGLIEASEKYPCATYDGINSANLFEVLENQHGIDPQLMNEHLVPLINSFLPASSPPHAPPPMYSTIATPHPQVTPFPISQLPTIPYVQNEMRGLEGRPKRQNVALDNRRSSGLKGLWKAAWEGSIAPFIPRRKHRRRGEEEERGILVVTPTSSSVSEPPTPLSPFLASESSSLQTQVLLSNGAPQTTLSNLGRPVPIIPQNIPHQENVQTLPTPAPTSNTNGGHRPRVAETEIGIAKLELQQGLTRVVRSRQGSKDSGINKCGVCVMRSKESGMNKCGVCVMRSKDSGINKSSENSNSFLDSDSSLDRSRRPTTLLIRDLASDEDLGCDGGERVLKVMLRKSKKRVGTPKRPMMPRLSLYNDSVMTGNLPQALMEACLSRSLPQDMNAVGNRRSSFPSASGSSSSSGKTGSLSLRQSERSAGSSSVEENGVRSSSGEVKMTITV